MRTVDLMIALCLVPLSQKERVRASVLAPSRAGLGPGWGTWALSVSEGRCLWLFFSSPKLFCFPSELLFCFGRRVFLLQPSYGSN